MRYKSIYKENPFSGFFIPGLFRPKKSPYTGNSNLNLSSVIV